jgi:hypothetical protein
VRKTAPGSPRQGTALALPVLKIRRCGRAPRRRRHGPASWPLCSAGQLGADSAQAAGPGPLGPAGRPSGAASPTASHRVIPFSFMRRELLRPATLPAPTAAAFSATGVPARPADGPRRRGPSAPFAIRPRRAHAAGCRHPLRRPPRATPAPRL